MSDLAPALHWSDATPAQPQRARWCASPGGAPLHRVSRAALAAGLFSTIAVTVALTARAAELRTSEEFFGPRIEGTIATSRPPPLRGDVVHRWNPIAIDASGLDHTPRRRRRVAHVRRAARTGPLEPRDGDRPHRDVRGRERDRGRLPELDRSARRHAGHVDRRRRRPGGPRHARRALPVAGDDFARAPRRRARARARLARACCAVSTSAGAPPRRSSRGARTTAPITASRSTATTSSRATPPAGGARIRSASRRRARRALGRGATVRAVGRRRQFRIAAAAADDERGVRGRVRRGEGARRRRREHADDPHRRADRGRHLLGLRRNAEPVRPAAALQPDRGARSRISAERQWSSSRGCSRS